VDFLPQEKHILVSPTLNKTVTLSRVRYVQQHTISKRLVQHSAII